MNKYQEALDEMCCGCYASCSKDGKPCLAYMKLQELINQTKRPTLKEIIKEWEKLGYKWKEEGREITLEHKERSREIYIDKIDKAYYSGYFLIFQELNLLTKTFKALRLERLK